MTYPFSFQTFPAGTFPAADWDQNWATVGLTANLICSVGGTANAIALTPVAGQPIAATFSLQTGMVFWFVATASNTGATSIQVTGGSGSTAYSVYDFNGVAITGGITSGSLYQVWFDPTLNSNVGGWRIFGGFGLQAPPRKQRSATSTPIVIQSADQIINCNITSVATCTLPAASTRSGNALTFKDVGAQAFTNPITISTTGGDLIDGAATIQVNANYQALTLVPANDGVNSGWSVE